MITLSGGPYDGQTVDDPGSEFVEMMPPLGVQPVSLDFSVPTVEPFRKNTVFYRRSMGNPNIFVFQP